MIKQIKKFNGKKSWGKLAILPFNRHFVLRNDLVQSQKKYGCIVPLILVWSSCIDGIRRLYVVDGQHKGLAAAYLDIPFYGAILGIEPKTKKEMVELVATLNATQKNWKIEDYINAYTSLGLGDYIELTKIQKQHQYSFLGLSSMLAGPYKKTTGGNSTVSNAIRTGVFRIKAKDATLESIRKVQALPEMNTRMLLAFHTTRLYNPKYNWVIFKKKFQDNYKMLKQESRGSYIDHFASYF